MELFPTILRNQGLSLCGVIDRGSMVLIPYLTSMLQQVNQSLPFVVMGVMAFLASAVGLMLPDTKRKATRETYGDFFDMKSNEVDNCGFDNKRIVTNQNDD